jgi:hypothetical protein
MDNTLRTAAAADATREIEAALDDITARGVAAIRKTKVGSDDTVAVTDREALNSARDLRATIPDVILHAIKVRPYTTLAIAGAIGFACGAMRRG